MKRYLSIFLALALAAPLFTGCDNDLDEYPSDAPVPAPSDKFTTSIQVVSRLNDATLGAADYAAVSKYIVTTLDGKNGSWLTIVDRADNGNISASMEPAVDTYRWTCFAFHKIADKTSYQGSMLYFNQCLQSGAKGVPSGKGAYVTSITTTLNGVRTDKDEAGEVISTAAVSFDVNMLTARFETADQIAAFGGKQGVLRSFYDANMPLLMIGTVKNELMGALQAAAQEAGSSYALKAVPVAEGAQYTIFMLTEERFWGLHGVEKTTLESGIDAYDIRVMW